MIKERSQAICRSRWFTPLICVAAGIVMFAVSWLGGQFRGGLISLAITAAVALVFLLLTSRSETVRGLTVGRDERFAQLDLRATALAGLVVLLATVVAWLVAVAHRQNGHPYDWLVATFGLAYLLAFALFRWRG